jgi:hypothetical protein
VVRLTFIINMLCEDFVIPDARVASHFGHETARKVGEESFNRLVI